MYMYIFNDMFDHILKQLFYIIQKKKKKKNTGEDFSQFQFLSEIIQFS